MLSKPCNRTIIFNMDVKQRLKLLSHFIFHNLDTQLDQVQKKIQAKKLHRTYHSERPNVQKVGNVKLYPVICRMGENTSISQHYLYHIFKSDSGLFMITLKPVRMAVQFSNLSSPLLPCLTNEMYKG